ncbi:MAG: hypothetical protein ACLRWM_05515 [Streptococcus sp.]
MKRHNQLFAKNIEPCKVKTKENILSMDVEMNKIIVSIKINEILSEPKEKNQT